MSDPMMSAPNGGRDEKGRFAVGNPGGPGRPRKIDLVSAASEGAERDGIDLRASLWRVVQALLRRALEGDVQASKLIFDRLANSDPIVVEHQGTVSDAEAARQIQALLATAEARKAAGEPPTG